MSRARAEVLETVLAPLAEAERARLAEPLGRLAAGLVRDPGATRWICRLCDTTACGHEEGHRPVTNAAVAKQGHSAL